MISVETINDTTKIRGTSLSGYLNVSYETLVDLLGEPNAPVDGYKTDAEWHVKINPEGEPVTYATIYNYKDGKNYLGANGLNVEHIKDWHVGAKSKWTFYNLEDFVESYQNV
tara:strand:- start:796 stop:1131 length:336 start_codon:yes stop_codon:yes gene_type:complete